MPCERKLKSGQTLTQRVSEIKQVVDRVSAAIASGKVTAKVGPTGAVAFVGLDEKERDGVTDNCLYRRILTAGSALAKIKLSGLIGVNKQAIAHGHHTHDGVNWHTHK